MGDRSYTYFKAYFWIGARSFNHHAKVENGISALDTVIAEHQGQKPKLIIMIEFQYAESFDFFSLFNKVQPPRDNQTKFLALQYSEYVRQENQ